MVHRLRRILIGGALLFLGCGGDPTADGSGGGEPAFSEGEEPFHVHATKAAHGGGHKTFPLLFHGGSVLTSNKTYAIWWGSQWSSAIFAGDKIAGMESFFADFGGSNYAATGDEYYGTNGTVTNASTFGGSLIDSSAPPSGAISVSQAVAEACKMSGGLPDPNDVYFLFTATSAGNVNYCAWHSYGTCSTGKPVQVAYIPNIDGIAGCSNDDTWTTHSAGLSAIANTSAHELMETITDPRNGGWWDKMGNENADKCAYVYQAPVTLSNRSTWKLQEEWSNAAGRCVQGN
jgi:hypothetical protein